MSDLKRNLVGKVALITGASSGIGRATALDLARRGADIALNYFTLPEAAEETAAQIRELGRKASLHPVDISSQPAVEAMVSDIVRDLGRVDIYISSAVYSDREAFTTANMDGFHRTIDVSLMGAFYGLRATANAMLAQKSGGAVVIVSSPHAHVAFPNCMAYNIAKAGLDQMARTAAMELLPHGIKVNVFYPGWTDTPGERKFFSDEAIAKVGSSLPMGRLASAEEMAHGIYFLIDPDTRNMTGSTLAMEGGLNLPFWSNRESADGF